MADGKNLVYNSLELMPISREDILSNIGKIISRQIPIFRMNIENKLVTVPHDRVEHYLGESVAAETEFYIEKDWNTGRTGGRQTAGKSAGENGVRGKIYEAVEEFGKADQTIEHFAAMSVVEREEILDRGIEAVNQIQGPQGLFDMQSIIETVRIVANTFYANYANINDLTETENVTGNPYGIYVKTEWIVQLLIDRFREVKDDYSRYSIIDEISTGSFTIDNMTKGLLWFIGFCLFYNDYIDKGLVTKNIRGDFHERHLRFYKKRLPDMSLSIERIVKGGLRRIDAEKEIPQYAVGSLLYDIGKLPFIVYHDGTDDYDENIVKMHVLVGYNMIQSTRKYSFPVYAMAAFHHEYYGGKGSYNFTNPIVYKITKKKRMDDSAGYFITYDQKEFCDGTALAYFPCKMIEIVDVFNALVYKKANPPAEALKIMKKHFIAQSLKIDPIIFDIFVEFKIQCGSVTALIKDELNAIKY